MKPNSITSDGTNADSEPQPKLTTSSQHSSKPLVVRSALVSCWVIRSSAFSIQCGGLERLFIHFSKPIYMLALLSEKDRDTPFGDISEQEGLYKKQGWQSTQKTWVNSQSVGNWIGYDNTVSDFIWAELNKHFHNEPFNTWHEIEKEGRAKIEDFCLEIKLCLSIS